MQGHASNIQQKQSINKKEEVRKKCLQVSTLKELKEIRKVKLYIYNKERCNRKSLKQWETTWTSTAAMISYKQTQAQWSERYRTSQQRKWKSFQRYERKNTGEDGIHKDLIMDAGKIAAVKLIIFFFFLFYKCLINGRNLKAEKNEQKIFQDTKSGNKRSEERPTYGLLISYRKAHHNPLPRHNRFSPAYRTGEIPQWILS